VTRQGQKKTGEAAVARTVAAATACRVTGMDAQRHSQNARNVPTACRSAFSREREPPTVSFARAQQVSPCRERPGTARRQYTMQARPGEQHQTNRQYSIKPRLIPKLRNGAGGTCETCNGEARAEHQIRV